MQKRTREIIALVLLVVLGIGVICAMGWYILIGHNWNVAASNIDDTIGQMDGYTVFLIEGTRPPEEQLQEPNEETAGAAAEDGSDAAVSAPIVEEQPPVLTLTELVMRYQEKGAEVFIVNSREELTYGIPLTLHAGSRTVGVFQIMAPARPAAAQIGAKILSRLHTDFNILVTNDPSLEGTSLPGINIVVFNQTGGTYQSGRYSNGIYCINVPTVGQIEAIIISPSGVISSKTISS